MKDCRHLIKLFPSGQNLKVIEQFDQQGYSSLSGSGNYSSKAFLIADLLREIKSIKKVLWICSDQPHKENVARALSLWAEAPVYDLDLEENAMRDRSLERKNKIKTMELVSLVLQKGVSRFLTVTYKDLFQLYPSVSEVEKGILKITQRDEIDNVSFFESLIRLGYEVSMDAFVEKGEYFRQGDLLTIWPVNSEAPIRMELSFDEVEKISIFDQTTKEDVSELKEVEIYPISVPEGGATLLSYFGKETLVLDDEVEFPDSETESFEKTMAARNPESRYIEFRSFMEETPYHHHLHYLSVLKYYNPMDFIADLREKMSQNWTVFLFTKHPEQYHNLFKEKGIAYCDYSKGGYDGGAEVVIFSIGQEDVFAEAFQNPALKLTLITDRNVGNFVETEKRAPERQKVYMDFLTGLKAGDFVVHSDHGIGQFLGLDKRTIDDVTREYLKIGYAENDKLFVPIDQADKVSKFIGSGDKPPRLTRLGSAEWNTIQNRVRKETEKIAQELLELYAERESARGYVFGPDTQRMIQYEKNFEYEETPGQMRAILDVKSDMEGKRPMDRLVCGDVGFGKTEVAMRAAFKAVEGGKQVAVLAPITILVDQHYKNFKKRMEGFDVRIEMLSRFRTPAEQKKILRAMEKGEIDIIIGTHRLLQEDIKFKDLGLVVIDEEQRFGVKQKEMLKNLRKEVHILTMTATPIPRTLNISLHGLRDISTITTPPPGRLPIVTEVRRFSLGLIKGVVEKEIERGGQIYFLHNRVQTIDDMASKLRSLLPKARIIVTHGKLRPDDLEQRILAFKNGEYDVLVSSTIIENGIDLPNANTLIVNSAERFGLAQLYQLRGRVGRSRKQAYAYFLYHMKRLPLDAKKRLRAIVEANELGAGFQIAMKDLEIRGAGDILGANQSGAIQVVGVSHFIRMLNQAVDDLKKGRKVTEEGGVPEVTIEIPLPAYVPDEYIISSKEKISVYQKLASADTLEYLTGLRTQLTEDYGHMPEEVANLFRVLEIKMLAKKARIINVKAENVHSDEDRQIILHMSSFVRPENILSMLECNANWIISGTKLKIKFKDLGVSWVEELKKSLAALGKKAKNVPGSEVEKA
ncbi:MAG: transcription-repair coupling factor [Candidatus Gracilibacteria bacterium]